MSHTQASPNVAPAHGIAAGSGRSAMRNPIYWIAANVLADRFPDPCAALREPDGLLATGGDLGPQTLLDAYRRGIFPWYSNEQPILWWSPDPRCVIVPRRLHVSHRLRRTLRCGRFEVSIDTDFAAVARACAAPRPGQLGTWLGEDMIEAYSALHRLGHAHSVECRIGTELVGGVYGVAIGRVFFGESMFSRRADASKVALAWLAANLHRWGYGILDCQVASAHLLSLGAQMLARSRFLALLGELCNRRPAAEAWQSWSAP